MARKVESYEAREKREKRAREKAEKAHRNYLKQQSKIATKERKERERIEKLRRQTELHIAHAEKSEALARRRKASSKARSAHPLALGKISVLGGKKHKKSSGKAWYDRIG